MHLYDIPYKYSYFIQNSNLKTRFLVTLEHFSENFLITPRISLTESTRVYRLNPDHFAKDARVIKIFIQTHVYRLTVYSSGNGPQWDFEM